MKQTAKKLAESLRTLLTKKVTTKELQAAKRALANYDAQRTLSTSRVHQADH